MNDTNNQNTYKGNYVEELERLRVSALTTRIVCTIIGLLIGFAIVLILESFQIWFIIFPLFFFSLLAIPKEKKFEKLYKSTVVLDCFERVFQNIDYSPKSGISKSVIKSTGMIDTGDSYSSNDYIEADYKNIHFVSADVHIEEGHPDGDGGTDYETIFRGQWYVFEFNKNFKSDLQVVEKNFTAKKVGSFFEDKPPLKKIELEDIEFNKTFNVYARDQIEAFYILTPSTMEKLKEIEKRIDGSFLFCFVDNRLHIGLDSRKDLYSAPSIFKRIDITKSNAQIMNDLKAITDFIDILELDKTLFKNSAL